MSSNSKYVLGIRLFALAVSTRLKSMALAFYPMVHIDQDRVLASESKWTNSLLDKVIIHGNIAICKESPQILFLVNAVAKCSASRTFMSYLSVFVFYPLKISVDFIRKGKLTLNHAIFWGKVIKTVIDMEHFGDHIVCFLCDRTLCCILRLYGFNELCKRTPRMDPTAGNIQIFPLFFQSMVDLISVCDHCFGKTFRNSRG